MPAQEQFVEPVAPVPSLAHTTGTGRRFGERRRDVMSIGVQLFRQRAREAVLCIGTHPGDERRFAREVLFQLIENVTVPFRRARNQEVRRHRNASRIRGSARTGKSARIGPER